MRQWTMLNRLRDALNAREAESVPAQFDESDVKQQLVGEYIESHRPPVVFEGTEDYLIIPRSVLQSMPSFWQYWLTALLRHMDRSIAWNRGSGYRAVRLNAEGVPAIDPYRQWSHRGKLRRILKWREARGFRVVDGALVAVEEPRAEVAQWSYDLRPERVSSMKVWEISPPPEDERHE